MTIKSGHGGPILAAGAAADIGAIRYRNVPRSVWINGPGGLGVPSHLVHHLKAVTKRHVQGQPDHMTDDRTRLTGKPPPSMYDFVKLHAAEFALDAAAA